MTPSQYKALRQQLGSQHAVANILGVSRPTIARRESTKGKITKEAEIAIKEITKNKP